MIKRKYWLQNSTCYDLTRAQLLIRNPHEYEYASFSNNQWQWGLLLNEKASGIFLFFIISICFGQNFEASICLKRDGEINIPYLRGKCVYVRKILTVFIIYYNPMSQL